MEEGTIVDGVFPATTKGKTVQATLGKVKVATETAPIKFKPKSGSLIPAKKKLVKTMMFDYMLFHFSIS
ncbi:hypothetical protein F0562_028073 [Nyssa sinensis]|uniref:Uncharacterized protein n=1 Tax=Nyssa sinensis TaxID=561372 RepID=A0A5J5BB00_9ASTE|nr:hypothetical protein F0562_028073 [Nyssa sinensis]